MSKRVRRRVHTVSAWWNVLRWAGILLAIVGLVLASLLDRVQEPSLASAAPNAPVRAVVAAPWGAGVPNGGWASTANLAFRITMAGSDDARTVVPEFELLPASVPFTGQPNVAGRLISLAADRHAVAKLPISGLAGNKQYHWRVRTRSLDGSTSPWVGGGIFGISVAPPTTPQLVSANVPANLPTNVRTISIHWSASTDRTGIAYYQWANSHDALAAPTWHATSDRELHLHDLGDGTWYLFVRAINRAGIPSAPLQYVVLVNRSAARIDGLAGTSHALGIDTAPTHIRFSLSQSATTTMNIRGTDGMTATAQIPLGVLPAGDQDIAWDGKDAAGNYLPSGTYSLSLSTVDVLGNRDEQTVPGPYTLDSRRVVVSLTKQDMTAYDGSTVLLHTLITSGGPETQTPIGTFHVIARYTQYLMRSPWPKSSRLWYPDSRVSYAILFKDGGYFLHDAPWRSVWGPGSNAVDGIPGGNTTGTHGCVNVPLPDEGWLYKWAGLGTVVQILP